MLDMQTLTKTLRDFLATAKAEQAAINHRIEQATEVLVYLTAPGSAPERVDDELASTPPPLVGARRKPGRPKGSKTKNTPSPAARRPMTAAQRHEVSVRMKKYWAGRRAAAASEA